jgi:hypothetical protein
MSVAKRLIEGQLEEDARRWDDQLSLRDAYDMARMDRDLSVFLGSPGRPAPLPRWAPRPGLVWRRRLAERTERLAELRPWSGA